MVMRNFLKLLEAKWTERKFVCVGLDSEFSKIPTCTSRHNVASTIVAFNRAIVLATKDLVCAYKPNLAFYEEWGPRGIEALWESICYIREVAPDVPVILDAKRADIGNTNEPTVKFAFGFLEADAITVNPYLGSEALKPFLDQKHKGVIVLCRTSNPGAGEFQDMMTEDSNGLLLPLYQHVARRVTNEWNKNQNCALVVGATNPDELSEVRKLAGDMPILIPGIGAQGGDLQKTVLAGKNSKNQGIIINSSRGMIFASKGEDFAMAARIETQKLHDLITQHLKGA